MNENQIRQASILVIDDQEDAVALLQQMLQKAGYTQVHTGTDSREAIALCQQFTPDLLILDLHMPTPSGFEILEQLGGEAPEQAPRFPVLVLTADVTPMTRLKALSMGAKDFLTKPVDHVDLLLRVHNLIEVRLLYRALDRRVRFPAADSGRGLASVPGDEMLAVLARLIEHCDPDLGERSKRVSRIAACIAGELDRPAGLVAQIELSTRIYDLGMLGLPGLVRAKSGLMTRSEQDLWRKHPTIAEQILGDCEGALAMAKQIAGAHHERWDGEGYPAGIKGEAIPWAARVVAAAESYDYLTGSGLSPEQAAEEIHRQGGFAFDPAVASVLASVVRQEPDGDRGRCLRV
jgi:response regulator RpfG family c-di-GMP phosphodiesterase